MQERLNLHPRLLEDSVETLGGVSNVPKAGVVMQMR